MNLYSPPPPATLPAVRTLEFRDGQAVIASLQYHLLPPPYAAIQILHVEVQSRHRRKGHATRLYDNAIDDARKLLGVTPLRRVIIHAGHKSVLPFRALLTKLGFHHVSTAQGVYPDEDILIYVKSYT
jgi:ribosomal protein S18 acetylase RimI-like enzyme